MKKENVCRDSFSFAARSVVQTYPEKFNEEECFYLRDGEMRRSTHTKKTTTEILVNIGRPVPAPDFESYVKYFL